MKNNHARMESIRARFVQSGSFPAYPAVDSIKNGAAFLLQAAAENGIIKSEDAFRETTDLPGAKGERK